MKKKHSVGYFSAYYRGLETLLDMWHRIRSAVPDATLDVYYGWESWVSMQGEDDFYHRMEKKFALLKDHGVTVHGRVSHIDLAKAMKETQVWAYPTQFEEIHCITALKAQEAGCYPVVTNVAALKETVQHDKMGKDISTFIKSRAIASDQYKQEKFADAVIEALLQEKTGTPVPGVDWADVAKSWDATIKEQM